MNDNDKSAFKQAMNTCCDVLGRPHFDTSALRVYFAMLEAYDINAVQQALYSVLKDNESSYGLKPALILKHLGESCRELSWQDFLTEARQPTCPMGILCRIHVKTFNLDNFQDAQNKHLALSFMDDLKDHKERALRGDYTVHEVRCMTEHNIPCEMPFMKGMPAPSGEALDKLLISQQKAVQSPQFIEHLARLESRHRAGLEPNPQGQLRIANELKKLSESIPVDNDNV